jgi:hypothetical protein
VEEEMQKVQSRSKGTVIAFPDPASRPGRPALRAEEARGLVLLFTGVRYERNAEAPPGPFRPLADGAPRRRRRRS